MYQVGVFNQAIVTTAASYLSGAAEGIRKYAPMAMLGRYVEKTLGTSENAYVAETATLLGELAQIGPNFVAGVIDVPAAVEHTIQEAGVVARMAKQEGVTTTLTHVTGTRQLMEALFGYDVITGEKVDRWAKAQEGLARFSSTLMTLAGAMETAGVDATLIPRATPEPMVAVTPIVGEETRHGAAPVYEVGLAKDLRANRYHGVATGTVAEHCPQTKWGRELIPGFKEINDVGWEPAIRVTEAEATAITSAERLTPVPASAREALAAKIRILREHTSAPNSAFRELIDLSKKLHWWDYLPLHRMNP
jgi:hypothetical protein